MTRDERLNKAIEGIRDLIERANIDMTIEEFVYRYATNRGIKKDPENVYRNLEKYQLYSDGNYKHLYNILEDSLNFMKPNPKEFNQMEYIKQYNKDNFPEL